MYDSLGSDKPVRSRQATLHRELKGFFNSSPLTIYQKLFIPLCTKKPGYGESNKYSEDQWGTVHTQTDLNHLRTGQFVLATSGFTVLNTARDQLSVYFEIPVSRCVNKLDL